MASLSPQARKLPSGKIELSWTPDTTCFGYRFYRDGVAVSKSTNSSQGKTNFAEETDGKSHRYGVARALEQISESVEFPATTPDPPPVGDYRWSPFTLTNPITINAPATGPWHPSLQANQDYIIKMPPVPMTYNGTSGGAPCISLNSGRFINFANGGHITRTSKIPPGTTGNVIGLEITSGVTGGVDVRDFLADGFWGQAVQFGLQSATDKPIIQIQNTRLEADHPTQYPPAVPSSAEVHTDALQSYGGPYQLRMDKVTLRARGSLLQIQPHNLQRNSPIGLWEFHRVNAVMTDGSTGNYALWKNYDQPLAWPIEQSDVWVDTKAYLMWANRDPWPTRIGWDPGPGWDIRGENWHVGLRPQGDFVPAGSVGARP